ncbi:MAG: EamA family transporter [Patescibacteria group bacterium]
MFAAFISAISSASNDVMLKTLLGKWKVPLKQYLPGIFILLAICMLAISPFGFQFDGEKAFTLKFILFFAGMIGTAVIWNTLIAKSLQKEALHEYELIILMAPLITMLMAGILFPEERESKAFIAGVVASVALAVSRIRKHHLVFSTSAKGTLLAVFFMGVESIFVKELLVVFSPVLLNCARVIVIAIVFLYIYKPSFKNIAPKNVGLMAVSAVFGAMIMVAKFTAFKQIGVVQTTLILLLGPVLTYAASYFYFKEKKNFMRDALAAAVVIIAIAYVNII